jgi:hypothetical protein
MAFLLGVLAIYVAWLLCVILVVVGAVWLVAPKPQRPAPVKRTAPPPAPVRTSPVYLRRWGLHRRAWVISEKAQWDREFARLSDR